MGRDLGIAGRLRAGVDPLGGDQELDIVNIGNFTRLKSN